jgi:hypothetical protein
MSQYTPIQQEYDKKEYFKNKDWIKNKRERDLVIEASRLLAK